MEREAPDGRCEVDDRGLNVSVFENKVFVQSIDRRGKLAKKKYWVDEGFERKVKMFERPGKPERMDEGKLEKLRSRAVPLGTITEKTIGAVQTMKKRKISQGAQIQLQGAAASSSEGLTTTDPRNEETQSSDDNVPPGGALFAGKKGLGYTPARVDPETGDTIPFEGEHDGTGGKTAGVDDSSVVSEGDDPSRITDYSTKRTTAYMPAKVDSETGEAVPLAIEDLPERAVSLPGDTVSSSMDGIDRDSDAIIEERPEIMESIPERIVDGDTRISVESADLIDRETTIERVSLMEKEAAFDNVERIETIDRIPEVDKIERMEKFEQVKKFKRFKRIERAENFEKVIDRSDIAADTQFDTIIDVKEEERMSAIRDNATAVNDK